MGSYVKPTLRNRYLTRIQTCHISSPPSSGGSKLSPIGQVPLTSGPLLKKLANFWFSSTLRISFSPSLPHVGLCFITGYQNWLASLVLLTWTNYHLGLQTCCLSSLRYRPCKNGDVTWFLELSISSREFSYVNQ